MEINGVGTYYLNLILENNLSRKKIIAESKVSQKTLDNFLHNRTGISDKKVTAIIGVINDEMIAQRMPTKNENDRLFEEVVKVYKRLPPDMQLQTLDHIRGLERIELARSNRS